LTEPLAWITAGPSVVQATVMEPFLAAAWEDPRRTTDPMQLTLLPVLLDDPIYVDARLVVSVHHDSLPTQAGLESPSFYR
jgi:hypothetical protein